MKDKVYLEDKIRQQDEILYSLCALRERAYVKAMSAKEDIKFYDKVVLEEKEVLAKLKEEYENL